MKLKYTGYWRTRAQEQIFRHLVSWYRSYQRPRWRTRWPCRLPFLQENIWLFFLAMGRITATPWGSARYYSSSHATRRADKSQSFQSHGDLTCHQFSPRRINSVICIPRPTAWIFQLKCTLCGPNIDSKTLLYNIVMTTIKLYYAERVHPPGPASHFRNGQVATIELGLF